MKRAIAVALICAAFTAFASGCVTMGERHPTATIVFSDFGTINFRLYPEYAPNTVANFIELANSGYYDGSPVHRIEEYFVIQMGKTADSNAPDAGYAIKGEFPNNGYTKNELEHLLGTVSMARSEDSFDSASAQFFICTRNQIPLDGNYAAFGRVTEEKSLNVLIKISQMDVDPATMVPRDEIYIVSCSVETFGKSYGKPKTMPKP
ncbi:MAG: peptidylprolyl isomerase [Oscillospiraceae bacterium]|jgi:peptidyl-prolyl cis-trans isomerase B (cyclophilin B)|nr:peptidylprolyl isomerase [Oscillospiraceae bacterium]